MESDGPLGGGFTSRGRFGADHGLGLGHPESPEFVPESEMESTSKTYLTVDQLEEGGRYYIHFTTAAGLYRYNINDLVEVTGFYHQTPIIQFVRKGMGGLAALVQTALGEQPFSGDVFVFRGRRGDLVKLLWFDGDGVCLFAKRLERGRFHFPTADAASLELTPGQLQMILDGVDVEHVRHYKRYQRPASA